jgi:hypothetical protein
MYRFDATISSAVEDSAFSSPAEAPAEVPVESPLSGDSQPRTPRAGITTSRPIRLSGSRPPVLGTVGGC